MRLAGTPSRAGWRRSSPLHLARLLAVDEWGYLPPNVMRRFLGKHLKAGNRTPPIKGVREQAGLNLTCSHRVCQSKVSRVRFLTFPRKPDSFELEVGRFFGLS